MNASVDPQIDKISMGRTKSYKESTRPASDTSYTSVLNRVHANADRKELTRKRRRRQFGMKTLVLVVAFFAVAFTVTPLAFNAMYVKYRVITDAERKEKVFVELQETRPFGTKYRNERLVWSDYYGYRLFGEYFSNGKWREYCQRQDPKTWPMRYDSTP